MSDSTLIAHVDTEKIDSNRLALMPTPPSTPTHQIIPHHEVVNAVVETLGFRHIGVHNMEFAVDRSGNKMFGLVEMEHGFTGARFALGIRNSHDQTMRLAKTSRKVSESAANHGILPPGNSPRFEEQRLFRLPIRFTTKRTADKGSVAYLGAFNPPTRPNSCIRSVPFGEEFAMLQSYRLKR